MRTCSVVRFDPEASSSTVWSPNHPVRLFEGAQKLRLELERNFPNLVEEDGSAVRQLEASHALADRAGKRTFFVAEKFALQQACGNSGTIQFYKCVRFAGTEIVDGAGFGLREAIRTGECFPRGTTQSNNATWL
jgi:hypothetical protein